MWFKRHNDRSVNLLKHLLSKPQLRSIKCNDEACIVMSCNNALQETKASMKALAIATVLHGIVNKNLQLDSLLNNYVYFGKYILKNDEKIRNNFIAAILCKLGL